MNKIIFLLFLLHIGFFLTAQPPSFYWTFDKKELLADQLDNKFLNIKNYNAEVKPVAGIKGSGIEPITVNKLIVTNLFKSVKYLSDFTIEFAFKGESFVFTTFPEADFRISFSSSELNVVYSIKLRGGKKRRETWSIPLTGTGITSYHHLNNNQWHHFAFIAKKKGNFEIWIDGKTDPVFTKKIDAFGGWDIKGSDGLRLNAAIDELAFYPAAVSAELIRQHILELRTNKAYSFQINPSLLAQIKTLPYQEDYSIDEKEFAPGYPEYTVQATDQLKTFPLPRYSTQQKLLPNFPWMAISYLHRELPGPGGMGFGKVSPRKAVELTDELAVNWNYYIELPTLRTDRVSAAKSYTNPSEIYSSLIHYANTHPELPVATVLMEVQNKPDQAGFDSRIPYVRNQQLNSVYYLSNEQKKPIVYNKKKWLNPFHSDTLLKMDGLTSAFYINQLARHLKRPVDIINENGEWFGHKWPEAMLKQSPEVNAFIAKTGMDFDRFNGWMQNHFDSVYKTTVLDHIPWKNTSFTFYNVSAYNSAYWPDYAERIMTNGLFNGSPRSTPAFYPARPDNWRLASGPLNGYGRIAEGRKKEFALGVRFFAPFVNAGWNLEEKNIRPAQWLGLLKSMVMLGADFFHVGYFNVTGSTGWPNGKGPNDPRGYIYQAAMPAYAQAIASRVWDFLEKGELLEDTLPTQSNMPYAFATSAPNHLVLVRKWNNQYLIFGSVQPNSNYRGNAPLEASTSITLEGHKITFNIRRQGSMYVYDVSGKEPVFYQLDGWHQYEHPWYWSKSVEVEAENIEGFSGLKKITERQSSSIYDFSTFNTYVLIDTDEISAIRLPSRRDSRALLLSLTLKRGNGAPVLRLKTTSGEIKKEIPSTDLFELKLTDQELKILQLKAEDELSLSVEKGSILLDKLVF